MFTVGVKQQCNNNKKLVKAYTKRVGKVRIRSDFHVYPIRCDRSYKERFNSVLFYSLVNILHGICLPTHLLCIGISFSIPRDLKWWKNSP